MASTLRSMCRSPLGWDCCTRPGSCLTTPTCSHQRIGRSGVVDPGRMAELNSPSPAKVHHGQGGPVAGERHTISNPVGLDLSGSICPPLRFVLQTTVEPIGVTEADGKTTICYTPWYTGFQSDVDLPDHDGPPLVLCHYILPATDDLDLLVASLGDVPQYFYDLLSGADFGDQLTQHVALHWPQIYDHFKAGTEQAFDRRCLMQVRTMQGAEWVLAEPLRGRRRSEVPPYLREDLMMAALGAALRLAAPWETLPELMTILGGPDRLSRRLNAVSGLLGSVSTIGGAFGDSAGFKELIEACKAAFELSERWRELGD